MSDTYIKIVNFIEKETGFSKERVSLKTRLFQDIKIDGDDAEDFLLKFSEVFDVDMTGFEFYRYFNKEGLDSFSIVKSLFGFGKHHSMDDITVEMLEKSAISGCWIDEIT